jgi:hypothetical protein
MKKFIVLLFIFITSGIVASSQVMNPWKSRTVKTGIVTEKAVSRMSFPKEYQLFDLELPVLRRQLFETIAGGGRTAVRVLIPNADNQIEEFELTEASNFEPALQARFPEIRAFSGRGITDKFATLKLSYSPEGVQAMVFRSDKENEFIEPYSKDHKTYAVFKSTRKPGDLPWTCGTPVQSTEKGLNQQVQQIQIQGRNTGNLHVYRLAQSVTAEYSNYFGATSSSQVNLVLAAINNTLTRCNGVYERDLALHLNLISNNTSIIYYNPSTDPYSPGNTGAGGTWSTELQNTLTSVIGEANYDIGHLFGATGGGGSAGCIGCVCVNGQKGRGFTSPADGIPQGDNFDIDYVVHEVGHQLGANHTFSNSNEGTGVNKEPGSGITIMGYAGITNQDLAPHSIDMYHATSIAQIQSNLSAKTCATITSISANNATPVVAALTNYTIPISTPFALTGSATDANNDPLTYCWEQNDNASNNQTGNSSVASPTKASGPNWISYTPSSSPTRLFPKLSTILAGALVSGPLTGGDAGANTEALSSVSRTLNFRLTVRDNSPYSSTAPVKVGQTQFRDMVVTVSNTSGPFQVTAPNTAVSWTGGTSQTITWNVANTTATPVSCANVTISLSTDGGQTFPTILASNTPNDGSQAVVIPNTPTATARIKIEAVGNIFFDISNSNFTITSGSSCGTATNLTSSSVTTNSATLSWTAVTGAQSYTIDYKLNSSSTWTNAATATTSTSVNISGLNAGSLYDWRVITNCATEPSVAATAQFTTQIVCVAPVGLTSTPGSTTATVSWTAVNGAQNYAVDYKLNSAATWISFSTAQTTTTASLTGLTASSLYDWRVRATCPSGTTTFSTAQFTTTATPVCNAPSGLSASSITSSSATVNWTAVSGAQSYAVDYKLNSSATWISAATATTSTSVNLTGLTASSLYDYRVRTNCGTNGTSSFTNAQFTTTAAASCVTAFEPNESLAAAATIVSGVTNSAAINTTTDQDYFKITTTTISNIAYNLVGPSGVDLDLYIYNSSGTQIGSSATTSSTESVSLIYQAAGTYYIRVLGYNGANSNSCYTIRATATANCRSIYDNTSNNATSGAPTIPFNTNITGQIETGGDVDHYRFSITTGGTITLSLTTLPANYNLRLVNSAGTVLVTSANSGTTNETINYTAAPGTYFARVYASSTTFNASSCYTLRVQLGTATREVTNANPSAVVRIYPNPVKDILNINLNGYEGMTDIGIYSVSGNLIQARKTNSSTIDLDLKELSGGIYLIKISNPQKQTVIRKLVKQ